MTWYHGGPMIKGDWILPPSETGVKTLMDWAEEAGIEYDEASLAVRDRVYLISTKEGALLFAAAVPNGWIYEVEPEGEVEDDPDFVPSSGLSVRSGHASRARIIRRFKPSRSDVGWARMVLNMR